MAVEYPVIVSSVYPPDFSTVVAKFLHHGVRATPPTPMSPSEKVEFLSFISRYTYTGFYQEEFAELRRYIERVILDTTRHINIVRSYTRMSSLTFEELT